VREIQELKRQGVSVSGIASLAGFDLKRQAAREVAVRRFETPPGHQAQVDWGETAGSGSTPGC
jgi:transposase